MKIKIKNREIDPVLSMGEIFKRKLSGVFAYQSKKGCEQWVIDNGRPVLRIYCNDISSIDDSDIIDWTTGICSKKESWFFAGYELTINLEQSSER